MSAVSVTGLAVTPIKGARLHTVDVLDLQRSGARGNRSFYLIDERGRMVNGKQVGALQAVDADPHTEDEWVGCRTRIGESVIRWHGNVGRCLVTSRDPESGDIDLPTLDILGEYRRDIDSTEPLPFGIYGEVLHGATIRIGDPVELADV